MTGGLCLLFISLWTLPAQTQHLPHYGQYMFNGLVLNPAYAGHKKVLDLAFLNRTQWIGFAGAPRTVTFAAHAPSRNQKHSFGGTLMYDRLGARRMGQALGVYSYRLFLGEYALSFGIQGGLRNMGVNFSQLGNVDDGDPELQTPIPNLVLPQVGTGLWLSNRHFYLGLSVPELIRVRSNTYSLYYSNATYYRHLFATVGGMLKLSPDLLLKPSILLKYVQAVPLQWDLNANLVFKDRFVVGASYRSSKTFLGLMEIYLTEQFRLGFAYEMNTGKLRTLQSGTSEISLGYSFGFRVKTPDLRYF